MTIHIPGSIGNDKIRNTADGAVQHFDIVACPGCSTTAAMQWGDRLESTDGPVDHVRITCVNRHWFLMPADAFPPGRGIALPARREHGLPQF
jgi:hypothetical protein